MHQFLTKSDSAAAFTKLIRRFRFFADVKCCFIIPKILQLVKLISDFLNPIRWYD